MNNKFRILSCFLVATLSLLLTSCVDIKKKENLDPYANESDLRVLNKSLADKSGKMIDVSKTLRKFEQAHDSSNEARCYVKHSGGYITDPVELEAIRKSFEYDRK